MNIDAVYIPLPNHLHKKWAIKAAQKNKHILCEKPIAMNAEEALAIKHACEENHIIFMEGFMYYFHPQHDRVREIIASGEIGDVQYMHVGFSFFLAQEQRKNNIRISRDKGGGSIYDIGCYAIHSLRRIIGFEPTTVHAHAKKDPETNVDTDVIAYIEFPEDVRASFDVSFNYARRAEYTVYGTKGRIIVPRAFRPDWFGGTGLITVEQESVSRTEYMNGDIYRDEVEHMSNAILQKESNLKLDLGDSIRNMHVIDACLKSIEKENTVAVETYR